MSGQPLRLMSLSQLSGGQDWRVSLAHDRPDHLLIWVMRGQGRVLIDGQRRGLGVHNAVFVPARHLFALDLGRQGAAHVLMIPDGADITLPQVPRHLRVRDIASQSELTSLMEATLREQQSSRALSAEAMDAHGALISIWLRRQVTSDEHIPARRSAGARLAARFCMRISANFTENLTMSDHAEALSVTPTHLTRVCKASTGRTAADLLTERTLYEARQLLETSPATAQDIARHLGFGSAAYFTRFIQQHCGMTPTQLRRTAQGKATSR